MAWSVSSNPIDAGAASPSPALPQIKTITTGQPTNMWLRYAQVGAGKTAALYANMFNKAAGTGIGKKVLAGTVQPVATSTAASLAKGGANLASLGAAKLTGNKVAAAHAGSALKSNMQQAKKTLSGDVKQTLTTRGMENIAASMEGGIEERGPTYVAGQKLLSPSRTVYKATDKASGKSLALGATKTAALAKETTPAEKIAKPGAESGYIAPGQAVHDVSSMLEKHKASTQYAGDIARGGDQVHGMKNQIANDAVKVAKTIQLSADEKKTLLDYRDAKEAGLPTKELSAKLKTVNDQLTELNKASLNSQREKAQLEGKEFTKEVNPETYTHREAQGKNSAFDRLLSKTQGALPSKRSLAKSIGSEKNRQFQAITDSSGERRVVHIQNESFGKVKTLTGFDSEGKAVKLGKFKYDPETKMVSNGNGVSYKLGQATTNEITKSTGQKYYVDPVLTTLKNYVDSRTAVENLKYVESIKNHPDFEKFAAASGETAPANWEKVDNLPQFMNYRFDPKVAETLRDLVRNNGTNEVRLGDKIGNFLKQSIVYFPLKHNLNQTITYAVDRGLSSFANPMAYKRGATSLVKAFDEVTNQGPLFQKLQRSGFSLPSSDEKAFATYVGKELKTLSPDSQPIHDMAKIWNLSPGKLYNAISHTAVWQYGDILNVARVIERMQPTLFHKGMSFDDALRETEKNSLQYKVPSRVGGALAPGKLGRSLSLTLQSPRVFFGRYKYDLYKIMSNTIKDTVNLKSLAKSPGKNLQAVDRLAAMAFGAAVVWPLVDKGIQKLAGNKNAYMKAPGSLELPETIGKLVTGKSSLATEASKQIYVSSAVQIPLDIKNNHDSFTGKNIYDPNAGVEQQWKQIGSWLVGQTSPGQNATSALQGAKGNNSVDKFLSVAKTVALKTSGVNLPKSSPEVNKLNSLKYDSLPQLQTSVKAMAQKGNFGGVRQSINQYDQQVLSAAKEALKASGMPVPSDAILENKLKKAGYYYAPKGSTIKSWQTKGASKNVLSTL